MSYENPNEFVGQPHAPVHVNTVTGEVIEGEAVEIGPPEIPPNTGEALALREPSAPATLFGTDDPELVLQKAAALAKPLAVLIRQQKLFTKIGGKDYVQVEGWTTLGSMLGVFPVLQSCEPVELGGIKGYVAIVNAQTRDGAVVGRAQSYCMRNESKWASAKDYAVASMAQTRATSKALRMPLGFIMQLAGYAPTPAEEREADQVSTGASPAGRPDDASAQGSADAPPSRTIVDALARIRQGSKLLVEQGNTVWAEDSIVTQASLTWQRPVERLEDLKLYELEEIIGGMRTHGGVAI